MPIITINQQPAYQSLNAAYRPIVYKVTATRTDDGPIPPVVYCDIYIKNVYYKTIDKTQYISATDTNSIWLFDVQDAAQEYLSKFLGTNAGSALLEAVNVMARIYCKFRSSGLNVNGFITPEGTAPVQATSANAAVAGTGTQSNESFICNSTLQHTDNQALASHLGDQKKKTMGAWDGSCYPLSHRPKNYLLSNGQCDYYPFIYTGDKEFGHITLNYWINNVPYTATYDLPEPPPPPSCPMPTTVATSDITDNSATISWNAMTGAVGYNIQIADSGGGLGGGPVGLVTSFPLTGLEADHEYTITIWTVCADGTSSPATVTFTTNA